LLCFVVEQRGGCGGGGVEGGGGEMDNSSIANWTTYFWVDAVVVICFLVETPNMLLKVCLLQIAWMEGEGQIKVTNSEFCKSVWIGTLQSFMPTELLWLVTPVLIASHFIDLM